MNGNLQIISGKYRGRKLALPRDARPTQNRARIALFNMLAPLIAGAGPVAAWDAFAGSGAMGIEILSRYDGASAVFTDMSADSIKTIAKNTAGMFGAHVETADALGAAKRHGAAADVIFIDPPYAEHDLGVALVRKLAGAVRPGAIVVWEMDGAADPKFSAECWTVLRDKTYGRARFLILEKR
jgi:16S rRNA (guanine(966)-N(2))-methyltransferase RsmD